ncbi:hypothetical protein V6N11_042317 [Hibiscus sabdariffa]|uniref:Bulb-type lectin domain-containing protein n=1 Tax=Hibiscus sabdariffa TaxID=183260 RepID=A0ABR2QWE7_9ROSI
MSPLSFQFIFISFFAFAATTLAKVPANQTFRFVNEGEFGGRIIEYDANYRVIETDVYSFYTFPFRLCFYNTTPDAHIFAIRAGIPRDESLMRWVWDANRNDPVRENAAFTFGGDGNFVLADVDGRVVWQTNTANQGVTENRINSRNKLVSRTSDVDGSDGPYSLVLDRNGFVMYLKYSGQQLIYGGWRVEDFGDIVTFDALPENENATAYEECALPSKCGTFGLCDKRMCVACPSPKGLLGWSESCKPPKSVPCRSGAKVDYYKIIGVEHFLNTYLNDGEGPMKIEQCREKCTKD